MDGREKDRRELAELLDVEPTRLPDSALLVADLALDSLAMMSVLTWLQARGVSIGGTANLPATVGDVLALAEKASFPGLSISVSGDLRLPGATEVPAPPPGGQSPLAPVLQTAALRLTPIEQSDIGFLYALASHPETCFRWRYRGAPPPFDRFAADLWAQVLVQYVARRTEDDQPVGHVVAYAAAQGLRHAYIGAVFHPQHAGTGLPAQAVTLFVRYLFHTFPLRKVYMEVPGFNWPQLRSGEGTLFQVEGVLRGHDYYAGREWDSYVCAIYPDQFTG